MFVEQVLRQHWGEEPAVMLDLCAAPGGKSTHVRSILPENSLLIANEVIRNRSQILSENLAKWGHTGVVVTNNEPSDFTPLKDLFDIILTDVPAPVKGCYVKTCGGKRVEFGECRSLLASSAKNYFGHLALPQAGWHPDI